MIGSLGESSDRERGALHPLDQTSELDEQASAAPTENILDQGGVLSDVEMSRESSSCSRRADRSQRRRRRYRMDWQPKRGVANPNRKRLCSIFG